MLGCFLRGASWRWRLAVQLPVQVSRLHLFLNQTLSLFAANIAGDGRQSRILTAIFMKELLGFPGCRVEVDAVVVSVLTLAVLLVDRFAARAVCLLATGANVVGLLLVTARSCAFLKCASYTAVLYLLVLACKDIVT